MTPLANREKLGNIRHLKTTSGLIDLTSNDYLGLARSRPLAEKILQEWSLHGYKLGSTGSRLLTGNSSYIESVESSIAHFHGYEAGLIFNCGYMANTGLLSSIATEQDTILFDAHIHASMREGITLSKARAFPCRHNDPEHLEKRLKNHSKGHNIFVCIESIYSTDGMRAPLQEIEWLIKKYGAHLIVDEAHAVGVYGHKGQGLAQNAYAHIVTCGKALGVHGALILGSLKLKEILVNCARAFIYTTAPSFHTIASIKCSYNLFPSMDTERLYLQTLIKELGSTTHIHAVKTPGNHAVKKLSQKLAEEGFDIRALTSPTVQKGHESLRVCLHTFNTKEHICRLKSLLQE